MSDALYQVRRSLAGLRRLAHLLVFGFEQIVMARLFEQHALAQTVTDALLHAKHIDRAPPELTVSRSEDPLPSWTHGFSSVNAALYLNLRMPDELVSRRHARPAPAFRAIYLWDSAFIAQAWKWWSPEVAADVLRSVIDLRDGDRLQHFASEFAASRYTQPPLVAWSLDRLAPAAPESDRCVWIEESYSALCAFQDWLCANRRLDNGLFAWAHAYESGVENAPRFGTRDERRLRDTTRTAAPDFSAYVVLQCEALAAMARTLGHDGEARKYDARAEEIRAAMNALLWCEEDGLYYDFDLDAGAFIHSRTIASLMPLWAGIPDRDRAERLIAQILDPAAFNTLIPIPSVACNDPQHEPDMWRGPVWVNTSFAIIMGLRRYGFHEAASELAFRLCDGVYRTHARTGHFYEFYDPTAYGVERLHRKRGNRWKRLTLGGRPVADFVGWTGLVNTLVLETLFGLEEKNGVRAMRPRFPPLSVGLRFALSLPLWELNVELEVLPGNRTRGLIETPRMQLPFESAFGEKVVLERGVAQTAFA